MKRPEQLKKNIFLIKENLFFFAGKTNFKGLKEKKIIIQRVVSGELSGEKSLIRRSRKVSLSPVGVLGSRPGVELEEDDAHEEGYAGVEAYLSQQQISGQAALSARKGRGSVNWGVHGRKCRNVDLTLFNCSQSWVLFSLTV